MSGVRCVLCLVLLVESIKFIEGRAQLQEEKVTLSGMRAPNSRNFGLRVTCKRRDRRPGLWLDGSLRLEPTVPGPQACIVSFTSQLRSLGHETL